ARGSLRFSARTTALTPLEPGDTFAPLAPWGGGGMAISRLAGQPAALREFRSRGGTRHREQAEGKGHAHFWERAMSRGALIKRVAGAGGAAATSGLWMPALARAGGGTTTAAPKPVPANPALGGLHIFLPGENAEPSS